MNDNLKLILIKLIFCSIIIGLSIYLKTSQDIKIILYFIAYTIVAYDIILNSLKNITTLNFFNENFLMTIATFGAFALKEYHEAIAVMFFYQIGEFFQDYAINKSRQSISSLTNMKPDYVNIERNGKLIQVEPSSINIDDIIIVKSGERVAIDGVIIEGNSSIDTSTLTGESIPSYLTIGDKVISGSINLSGTLKIKVSSTYENSTLSRILDLIENATSQKTHVEKFITRFSRYYTPIVILLCILVAIIPPILFKNTTFSTWFYRSLILLVISCPCALIISIPLSFFASIGKSSKEGILIKGSNYIEMLTKITHFVFDKTGTLTYGNFKVVEINTINIDKKEFIRLVAHAEYYSHHPIAESIKKEYKGKIKINNIANINETRGMGVIATVDNHTVAVGNIHYMEELHIYPNIVDNSKTTIYVSIDGEYSGYIVLSDEIKKDSAKTIKDLRNLGIKHISMLTGDKNIVATNISNSLGIKNIYSELLPEDKLSIIEKFIKKHHIVAFVGDGINDAPVIARSDIGIAMGSIGSDATIDIADIVIMNDEISKIPTAIKIARKTMFIVKENICLALGIKLIILIFNLLGKSTMWSAIFADVGVCILTILNAMRIFK